MNEYKIEELIKKFKEDAKEYEKYSKEFNLPLAFLGLTKMIKEIKERLDNL